MASPLVARQRFVKTPSEVRTVRVGFKDLLESGELLTGTPTLSVSPSGLTTASAAVNVATLTINGVSYVAGQAVTFTASSGTADTLYEVSITVSTDASQTFQRYIYIAVETSSSGSGEPTAGGDYDVLRRRVGDFLGKSLDPDDWSQNDFERICDIIDAGYRQFLHPPVIPGDHYPHSWSFLRPSTTLTLWGDVTGTMSGAPSYSSATSKSTITATTSVFYATMVGKVITFDDTENEYTITDYTSATAIKVSGDASGETSGDGFTVTADGDYQLSDDFGFLDGRLYFAADDDAWRPMEVSPEGRVYSLRQRDWTASGNGDFPEVAAIVPINSTGSAEGQRHNLSVWPTPVSGATMTLTYKYHALQNALTLSRPFALGGAAHFETLLSSCLAMAEDFMEDQRGPKWARWMERLTASVGHDRHLVSAKTRYGYVGDPSMNRGWSPDYRNINAVTFDGTLYEP
jgi:hypothetical protein